VYEICPAPRRPTTRNHEDQACVGQSVQRPHVPKLTARFDSRHLLRKLTPGQKPLFLERPGLMAINCGRRIAGVSQSWRWRLGHRSARACRPGLFVGRVEIRNTSGAGARRAIRTAATTELIRRPENCHPRRRPADSLMADDGVRRIRLFHICDLVLGQSDGEGADGSFQMRNLRCPDDRGRHRLLL
jgi:hypothetical protein